MGAGKLTDFPNRRIVEIDSGNGGSIYDLNGNDILDPEDNISLYTGTHWDPVAASEISLRVIDVNAAPASFFGVASLDELRGKSISNILAYSRERQAAVLSAQAGRFGDFQMHLTSAYAIAQTNGFEPKESYETALEHGLEEAKTAQENCSMCQ